jgi:ferredoxin-NADP reductase
MVNSLARVYCGPSPMMHGIGAQCRRMGLPRGNVVMEEFSIR